MSPRENLLRAVFAALDHARLDYCVSRNHSSVFEDSSSDVDLLVRHSDLAEAEKLTTDAARGQEFSCILRTRFANRCLLFWKAPDLFLRIDFETELRWRVLPVAAAGDILSQTERAGPFRVPSTRGEAAILLTKALWLGRLSKRYRDRLAALVEADRPGIIAMPGVGQRRLELLESGRIGELRRDVMLSAIRRPRDWARVVRYGFRDVRRLLVRAWAPPGIVVQVWGRSGVDFGDLGERLEMAFPSAKTCTASGGTSRSRGFLTLFRGGMLLDARPRSEDDAFESGGFSRKWEPLVAASRRFRVFAPPGGPALLVHEASGRISPAGAGAVSEALPAFIGEALARQSGNGVPQGPGRFVVLVGLDGAGKTTFSRTLCERAGSSARWRSVRYFHWIPRLRGLEFPLPALTETPRKNSEGGASAAVLSVLRLLKNLLLARLSYHLRVRPLIRRGALVLVDRFVYNYWIDPVSLRYSGPTWCLNLAGRLFPKPDLVVSLEAAPEVLLARKGELTREQMEEMSQRIRRIPIGQSRLKVLDAARTPAALVEEFHELPEIRPLK